MHTDLVQANSDWDDRIEVIYISTHGLANYRTETTTIAVISSGEPFQVVEAGPDWILNWYPAREDGLRLLGPPIAEYLDQVRRYLLGFPSRIPDHAPPGQQAYAILTMCRGLYAIRFGDRLSKRAAAWRAQQEFPQRASRIGRALGWRQRQHDPDGQDGAATVAETPRS
jgi:aminoglycoside adenylyltransferase-like protein